LLLVLNCGSLAAQFHQMDVKLGQFNRLLKTLLYATAVLCDLFFSTVYKISYLLTLVEYCIRLVSALPSISRDNDKLLS